MDSSNLVGLGLQLDSWNSFQPWFHIINVCTLMASILRVVSLETVHMTFV